MEVKFPRLGLLILPGCWRDIGHLKRGGQCDINFLSSAAQFPAALFCFKVPELLVEVGWKCRRSGPRNYLVVGAKVHNWEIFSAESSMRNIAILYRGNSSSCGSRLKKTKKTYSCRRRSDSAFPGFDRFS
jgi:hypothetical protein